MNHPRSAAPFREVYFPPAHMRVETRADGTLIVEPEEPLQPFTPNIPLELARQAERIPDQPYLAERTPDGGGWQRRCYGGLKRDADAFAAWLLDAGIAADRSVLILSGNSILHAIAKFGAMAARIPVCPVSVNYSLLGGDYGRLHHVIQLVRPAVIFAEQASAFGAAIDSLGLDDAIVVTDEPALLRTRAVSIADVLASPVDSRVACSIASIDPDEPSCYMLTSGSTSLPKAVIQTQRMIAANLAQGRQVLGETAGWRDVMLDWLPWNHVSGAFTQMGVLTSGGTLYIDNGRPMPGLFAQSIRNLKEISVQFYTNVPAGYAMLADALEADAELRQRFFGRMRLMLYGGAGLPQALYDRLQALAVDTTGHRIFFTTGYGATETTSGCMAIYFHSEQVGIGLPMPGLTVKLVPLGDRYELRMKGPMVTRGYLGMQGDAGIFDEEGYFMIRDTARFLDPADIHRGLVFAGRLAEEFKLATGTWVSAGQLRAQFVQACNPLIADALICGEDRDYVAALAWLRPDAARRLQGDAAPADGAASSAVADPRDHVRAALERHNREHPGSSTRIRRVAILTEAPSANAHEISDKGTINQAVAKLRRAADVARLYANPADPTVIVVN